MPYDIIIGRDEADKKRFAEKGLIYLGKGYVTMGNYTSLSNLLWMDVARSHVVLIAGKRGCLTGETLIFIDKGYKEIKNFNEKEDKVLSFNKEEKKFEWEKAELLKYPINNEELLEIEFVDNRKLKLTKEHPLLVTTGNKLLSLLWINAIELKKGDRILSIGKSINDLVPLPIKSIKEINEIKEVYDLSINKNHSFIANGIISHNSGKSYSIGVMAEELADLPSEVKQNIASLIFDTMGIFWTMKFKNEKEKELLSEWKLKAKNLPVRIFAPFGYFEEYQKNQIPVDKPFALKASELEVEDWLLTFNLSIIDPISILVEKSLSRLKEQEKDYGIQDILEEIQKSQEKPEIKKQASALFEAADTWKIFAKAGQTGTEISDLIEPGKTTILDLSVYSSVGSFNVRALVIALVSRKLFTERMAARKKEEIEAVQKGIDYLSFKGKREMPLVWLFIDECLTGNTEIITEKAHTPIQEIVKGFKKGEKFKVLGFDKENNCYDHYDVTNVYEKGKRKIIKITTETGRELTCTPEHRVLTKEGFASAFSVNEIAFPLAQHYSTNKKLIEARVLGHLFGDGWISDKTKSLGFSGKGNKGDLEKIRKDLQELGFKSTNIYERETNSKIEHKGKIIIVRGLSQSFQSTSAFKYFREKAGFAGEKAIAKIKIPYYLSNVSDLEKAEFLAALMGSDGQKITKAKFKGDFNAIRFSFNKIESFEKEAFDYANQIKKLFEDLGIKVSSISKKEGNLRKDGNKTIKFVITLEKNIENTIRFLEKIGYRYCSEKELGGLKWLEYLRARLFLKNEREKIKQKALELHSSGMGKVKISRKLKFPEAQIRDWIYNNTSPGLPKAFPDFEEWTGNRKKEKILFERIFKIEEIGDEEVYDISVDKVHNFVSNGLITHNCHEFLPEKEKTPATDALIQLLREGRQPGISLVLATQQPGAIHRDVMTQSDIIISHRVTAKPDIMALNNIMQTYLLESIKQQLDALPNLKGSAIILDDNSERIYPMRIRPRFTWHGGEAPTAIKVEKRL